MSDEFLATVIRKLELVDKLLRWQIALFTVITAGAVWSTAMNLRVGSIEADRALRIPLYEAWRSSVDKQLTTHEARLYYLEKGR